MAQDPAAKSEMEELERYLAVLQQFKLGAVSLDLLQPILADLDMRVDKRVYMSLRDPASNGGMDASDLVAAWYEKLAIYNLRTKMYKLAAAAKDNSGPRLGAIGRGGQA